MRETLIRGISLEAFVRKIISEAFSEVLALRIAFEALSEICHWQHSSAFQL